MSRRFFHCLCVVLLLMAQQGALSHAAWHAASGAQVTHHTDTSHPETPVGQAHLCGFDMAFNQMLGGAHGVCVLPAIVASAAERLNDVTAPRLRAAALAPKSRGPPALS